MSDAFIPKKRYSLRRIYKELGVSRNVVRKKLFEAGVENFSNQKVKNIQIEKKINALRQRGYSYQRIADIFNLWKVETRSGEEKWFGKTVRDFLFL